MQRSKQTNKQTDRKDERSQLNKNVMTMLSAIAKVSTASANFNARQQVHTHTRDKYKKNKDILLWLADIVHVHDATAVRTETNTLLLKGHWSSERVHAVKLFGSSIGWPIMCQQ